MSNCKDCGSESAHPQTMFGLAIGFYCGHCYRSRRDQAGETIKKSVRQLRESVANAMNDRQETTQLPNVIGGPEDGSHKPVPDGDGVTSFKYNRDHKVWCRYSFCADSGKWVFVESIESVLL